MEVEFEGLLVLLVVSDEASREGDEDVLVDGAFHGSCAVLGVEAFGEEEFEDALVVLDVEVAALESFA